MEEIILKKSDKKVILLGNEAIVRGAFEAGVQFIATYPGTPATEVGDTFFRLRNLDKNTLDYYFEYSVNEKVAMETGIGASFSGLKTLVAMKNFGLNVSSDSFLPFMYTGSKGPFVLIVADDPSCHSSAQTEENTRPFSYLGHIPTLEPADPQECKDFTKLAFEISAKYNTPVMVRTTTRVAHQKMPVSLDLLPVQITSKGNFVKDTKRFVTLPPRVMEMKGELLDKIERIKQLSEKSSINSVEGLKSASNTNVGIIASGISYLHVKEALKELDLNLPILKLGFFYPLPEEKIRNFIKNFKTVLIVEELEPYIEKEVEGLAKSVNCKIRIVGKELLPQIGEIKPEYVVSALARLTKKSFKIQNFESKIKSLKRFPQLCPACPYRLVAAAVKKAVSSDVIFGGDIGCYMLFGTPSVGMQDYLLNMGSSIGVAHGIKKATGQKLITFIGDSTFFHVGIPALINTIFNNSNPLIVILDNRTTAMTGQQPNPGAPVTPNDIKIEEIVRACGVKNLKILDPIDQGEFVQSVQEFLEKPEVSVIIAKRPCIWVKK